MKAKGPFAILYLSFAIFHFWIHALKGITMKNVKCQMKNGKWSFRLHPLFLVAEHFGGLCLGSCFGLLSAAPDVFV